MSNKVQPVGAWIALKIINEAIETQSGIALSDSEKGKLHYKKGEVINVGKDVVEIKAKDIIYYHKGESFTMLSYEGEMITWIRERDVLCVV